MKTVFLAATAAVLLLPSAAQAHATLEQAEAPNGGYQAVIRVPHGCDGKATHTVRIELPEGFISAKPMPKPGWDLTLDKGDYQKAYMNHGREVTSGLKTVTWSGGNLPDDQFDEFVVNGTLSGFEPGAKVYFKATQLCDGGEVAWVDIPAEGQDPHDLKGPAPVLQIAASEAQGHDHGAMASAEGMAHVGDIMIEGFWARAMLPNQPVAGGFLTLTNGGETDDRIVNAVSPRAGRMELHEMAMEGEVMKMREVEGGIAVPAGATVELKPGGLHLMFFDIGERFEEGQTVPVTLTFEKAGEVTIELPVKTMPMGEGGNHNHGTHNHGG